MNSLLSTLPLGQRMIIAFAALFALTAAVLSLAPARALTDDTWTVLARSGATSWRMSVGEGGWQDLQMSTRVPGRAQIRTGSNGHAVVAHSLDRIEVQPNSTVVVTASAGDNGTMEIYQDSGAATYSVEKRPAGTFAVRTPYVVAVVKGTRFTVEISETETTVTVTEGVVAVSDRRNGETVDVMPGETASAASNSPGVNVGHVAAGSGVPAAAAVGATGTAGANAGVTDASGAVGSAADAVAGAVEGIGGTVEGVGDTAEGVVDGVGGTVGGTVESVAGAVGGVVDGITGRSGGIGGGGDTSGGSGGGGSGGGGSGGGGSGGGGSGGGGSGGGGSGGGGSGGGDSGGGDSGGGDSGGGDSGGADSGGDSESGGGGLGDIGDKARDAVGGLL